MPRKPDPLLEQKILQAALRILDSNGPSAVTMREVAKTAGTTTPTLYERFKDRDSLIEAMTDFHRDRLMATLSAHDTLEQAGSKFFAYCRKHPNTIHLLLRRIAGNLKSKKRGPMYQLVRRNLIKVNGFKARDAEEMTMATSSMIFGTALLMSNLGCTSAASAELERVTIEMMRRLVSSYGLEA